MEKHTLTLRIEEGRFIALRQLAEEKGYKSLNRFINEALESLLKEKETLPKAFRKPLKVESYHPYRRDELHER